MPQAQQPKTVRKAELPIAGRSMALRDFKRDAQSSGSGKLAPLATAQLVFTAGAAVRRYDWYRDRPYMEQLVVEPGSIRMDRLQRGAPLLNSHSAWDLEDQLGVVDNPAISDGLGTCTASFSRRDSVAGYVQDVADGVIRNVSVGYVRHRIEMVAPEDESGVWTYRVVDWEPMEVSLVPIPADMDSQVVRSAAATNPAADAEGRELRTYPCEFIEIRAAGAPQTPAVGASADPLLNPGERSMTPEELAAAEAKRAADEKLARDAAVAAEQLRGSAITELCTRHNVPQLAAGLIRGNQTVEQAREAVLNEIAVRDAAAGGHRNVNGSIVTQTDEHETRMAGIQEALFHRVDPKAKLTDNGRQYRGMTLLELGREMLEARGIRTRGMDRMSLATRVMNFRDPNGMHVRDGAGMLSTSDFPSLLQNIATKRLRQAYSENPGSYQAWARRAPNAPDFKTMSIVQLGGAPDLLQVNEHGEFKYGAVTDGKETYGLLTYGRIVSLTRQAMVNDDLRGFDRLLSAFGNSAARLENRTVYSQLTANAAMSDGVALFHASHGNLQTGAGSALQFSSLTSGRAAMRLQKGYQSEELNIAPAFLIVPAALEQTAYQLTSTNYLPAKQSDVNEFRTGGRTALEPVIEPVLDANSTTAWYLGANNGQVDTVEYCFLDGADGPMVDSEIGFEVDGMSLKCRLDFAAKAIDYRGLNKAAGV